MRQTVDRETPSARPASSTVIIPAVTELSYHQCLIVSIVSTAAAADPIVRDEQRRITNLAVFCRRLNRELRIVSRITHERNLEAIHRAGADFVLSYTTLGIEAVMSLLRGYPPVTSSGRRVRQRAV
jgi:hypothetical protein